MTENVSSIEKQVRAKAKEINQLLGILDHNIMSCTKLYIDNLEMVIEEEDAELKKSVFWSAFDAWDAWDKSD